MLNYEINKSKEDKDCITNEDYNESTLVEAKNDVEEDLINEICKYYYNNDDKKTLDKYLSKVIKLASAKVAFWMLDNIKEANSGIYKKLLSEIIFEKNDPYWITMYAKHIKGANKKLAESIILSMKNPFACYYYCLNVKGANIKAHEYVFYLFNEDPKLAYLFAKNIKKSDKELHLQNIKELNDEDFYNLFKHEIGDYTFYHDFDEDVYDNKIVKK